jgi:hypothetical protein
MILKIQRRCEGYNHLIHIIIEITPNYWIFNYKAIWKSSSTLMITGKNKDRFI